MKSFFSRGSSERAVVEPVEGGGEVVAEGETTTTPATTTETTTPKDEKAPSTTTSNNVSPPPPPPAVASPPPASSYSSPEGLKKKKQLPLVLSGMVWKKRGGLGGMRSTRQAWEQRYMELRGTTLMYFDLSDDTSLPPRGVLELKDESCFVQATFGHTLGAPSPFCLSVSDKWKLALDSQQWQMEWLVALSNIVIQSSVDHYNQCLLTASIPSKNKNADKDSNAVDTQLLRPPPPPPGATIPPPAPATTTTTTEGEESTTTVTTTTPQQQPMAAQHQLWMTEEYHPTTPSRSLLPAGTRLKRLEEEEKTAGYYQLVVQEKESEIQALQIQVQCLSAALEAKNQQHPSPVKQTAAPKEEEEEEKKQHDNHDDVDDTNAPELSASAAPADAADKVMEATPIDTPTTTTTTDETNPTTTTTDTTSDVAVVPTDEETKD